MSRTREAACVCAKALVITIHNLTDRGYGIWKLQGRCPLELANYQIVSVMLVSTYTSYSTSYSIMQGGLDALEPGSPDLGPAGFLLCGV